MFEQARSPVESGQDRPRMPAGYGIAGGGEGMLSWSWIEEQLTNARNYWVVTARPDGRPHAMPVWGVWVEGACYFGTDRGSRKARNLAANPEIVIHLESGDDVVILEGRVEELTDPDTSLLDRLNDTYAAKYINPATGEGFRLSGETVGGAVIYALRPRIVLAWLERDFPRTATRWRLGRA